MAETNIILSNNDAMQIVAKALEMGAVLVPDCHYEIPEYVLLTTLEEYEVYKNKNTKLFFVIHDDWIVEPLHMREFTHKTKGKRYFISQKNGGPSIDFFFNGEFSRNNKRYVGTGLLAYHSKFWSDTRNEMTPTPEELKKFYRLLVSDFKKNAIAKKTLSRTYWISKEANDKLQSGEMELAIQI